jgi:hypothetical protein
VGDVSWVGGDGTNGDWWHAELLVTARMDPGFDFVVITRGPAPDVAGKGLAIIGLVGGVRPSRIRFEVKGTWLVASGVTCLKTVGLVLVPARLSGMAA